MLPAKLASQSLVVVIVKRVNQGQFLGEGGDTKLGMRGYRYACLPVATDAWGGGFACLQLHGDVRITVDDDRAGAEFVVQHGHHSQGIEGGVQDRSASRKIVSSGADWGADNQPVTPIGGLKLGVDVQIHLLNTERWATEDGDFIETCFIGNQIVILKDLTPHHQVINGSVLPLRDLLQ